MIENYFSFASVRAYNFLFAYGNVKVSKRTNISNEY